jgi:4-methylaminobutanoate oxidase (formaldehyde-forming)
MSLAKGARNMGVKIREQTGVLDIRVENNAVIGVETTSGFIKCEKLLIAAGTWSREIGRMAGVNIPLQPCHHQYMVSEQVEGVSKSMPSIRDPDKLTYYKEEVGGLVCGGYEFNPIPHLPRPTITDEGFKLFPEEFDHFEQFMPAMLERFPGLQKVGVKQWFNGLEGFTEDTNFILGEAPEVKNIFVSSGYNAMGIAAGGGAGMAIAHWMTEGEAPFDLWPVDIRRFSQYHRSDKAVLVRSLEGQGHHYAMHWPFYEFKAERPLRKSAVYDNLKEAGASFGSKAGWERANWFAPKGVNPVDDYSWGDFNWFPHVAEEHRACREDVALFDQSSFSKALLVGPDAEKLLQRICAGDLSKAPGRVTYTQMLNERGGIECDLTFARLSDDTYYVVTGTAVGDRDFGFIKRSIKDENVSLIDVTSQYGVFGLMGPKSRDVLKGISEGSLDNEDFPFGHVKEIMVAGAPVRAMRMTFVGELGWELHVPTEYMKTVYDALHKVGAEYGLKNAGYRALDGLRIEKRFCVWGAEVGPDYTPLEAGIGFAVDFNKKVDFVGRAALEAARQNPQKRRLVSFSVDNKDVLLLGRETIFRNGEQVGWLTSGGFGHTIGKPLGAGYVSNADGVTKEYIEQGEYELEVAGVRMPANVHWRAIYDPSSKRVKL